jgi:hypothetical protein
MLIDHFWDSQLDFESQQSIIKEIWGLMPNND